jgi:hypothetical protein
MWGHAHGIFYGFVFAGVVAFLMGTAGKSGNNQSKDATATLMSHPGGRWLILLIGLVVTGAGDPQAHPDHQFPTQR